MKRVLTTLLLMLGLCTSAQATLVYSFTSSTFDFKFTTADFLAPQATVQAGDLFDVVNPDPALILASVDFLFLAGPGISAIELDFAPGSPLLSTIHSFVGAFDHLGTYISYGFAGPGDATLTISDTAVAVPEPGSLFLLGTALGALALARRRQRRG